jgi:hypothetical protein
VCACVCANANVCMVCMCMCVRVCVCVCECIISVLKIIKILILKEKCLVDCIVVACRFPIDRSSKQKNTKTKQKKGTSQKNLDMHIRI